MDDVTRSEHLARAIEARRRDLDMTVGDLAEKTGLSRQALLNVRRGDVREYQERLTIPLTRALGWTPDSIDRLLAGDQPLERHNPADQPDELSQLRADVAELQATVRELAALVRERLRAAADDERSTPDADGSTGLEPPAGEAGPPTT